MVRHALGPEGDSGSLGKVQPQDRSARVLSAKIALTPPIFESRLHHRALYVVKLKTERLNAPITKRRRFPAVSVSLSQAKAVGGQQAREDAKPSTATLGGGRHRRWSVRWYAGALGCKFAK